MTKRRFVELILTVCLVSLIIAGNIPGISQNQSESSSVFEETESQVTIIEGVREYSLSAETSDYVDYSYTPTYGSHTNEPSNGMGQDSDGSAGARTTLIEGPVTYNYWDPLQTQSSFSSLPSGWTSLEIGYSGGYFQESGIGGFYGGHMNSSPVDTRGSNIVSFSLDIGGSWGTDEVSIQFWDGSSWDTMGACSTGSITTQTWSSSDPQYRIADFHVQLIFGIFDGSQSFQANGWLIEARYEEGYQAFQAVYRFDTVDFDSYSVERIHVNYSEGFSSSENLVFRFDANDVTPNNVIQTSNGELDFSVDVHSYVTGDTCYLDIRDANRADTDDTTNSWTIDRVFLLLTEPEPMWDDIPADMVLEYAQPLGYQMNATLLPASDSWWLNDSVNFAIDGSGFITNASILSVGTFGVQVSVNDTWGRTITDDFMLTVQDTVNPDWTTPIVNQAEEYGYNFTYAIEAYDVAGIKSWGLNNSVEFKMDNGVITNNTLLAVGYYWLNVSVLDNHDNKNSDVFRVFINDTVNPVWDFTPVNQFREYGLDFLYDLNATDLADISWHINDTAFEIDAEGVIQNVTGLSVQNYGLRVTVEDAHGNTLVTTFDLLVNDTVSPGWIISPEYQFSEYKDGFDYQLSAFDLAGIIWDLDNINFSIDSSGKITNATILEIGNYTLLVTVTDSHGLILEQEFTVEVRDTTPPNWDVEPGVQNLEYGEQLALQLYVSDRAGIAHWNLNNTEFFSIEGSGFLTSLSNLDSGWYYVNVTATDEHGLSSWYVITVFVGLSTATSTPTTTTTTTTTTTSSPPPTTTETEPPSLMLLLGIGGVAIGAVVLFASLRTWKAIQRDRVKQLEDSKGEVDTALDYLDSIKPSKDDLDNDE